MTEINEGFVDNEIGNDILCIGTLTFSNPCDKIAEAMVLIQAELGNVQVNSVNDHFRNKYADLGAVLALAKPIVTKHGCAIISGAGAVSDKQLPVTTVIMHKSGQYVSVTPIGTLAKDDPQGLGSAQTYFRRYGATSLLGIAQEDDDGNAGSGNNKTPSKPPAAPPAQKKADPPKAAPAPAGQLNEAQLTIIDAVMAKKPSASQDEARVMANNILTAKSGGSKTDIAQLSGAGIAKFRALIEDDADVWSLA